MRTLHTDHDARTFRTADGTPVPTDRIAGAYATEEGTPELLVLDGYDGTGDVLARFPLPYWGNGTIDTVECERLLEVTGFTLARVIVDGFTPQPDPWLAVENGYIATVVRGA